MALPWLRYEISVAKQSQSLYCRCRTGGEHGVYFQLCLPVWAQLPRGRSAADYPTIWRSHRFLFQLHHVAGTPIAIDMPRTRRFVLQIPQSRVPDCAQRAIWHNASEAPSTSTTALFCEKKQRKFTFSTFIRPNPITQG
ncbi:hypothetical protein COCC4DRAFT_60696 [Bipolaris maydis ATCC 48331]|uniref:Uncharacterized protein n=2 Tax=Cochliobolus heterostrophus TaxID=5016 RepID=M2STF1_COCH5|nr:uncharacterized protein COCC4DRAFT_60696 [Bipolaris maydis ATCC 48331]EMD88640.1 hypothetical protein COCHEDRAFT_1110140 [Bipolaris maydis C5]ENI05643.1 hypothetical protein COCC4DRAFT_60696 [Bipolaris maydis ATCC 48331]